MAELANQVAGLSAQMEVLLERLQQAEARIGEQQDAMDDHKGRVHQEMEERSQEMLEDIKKLKEEVAGGAGGS